MGAQGNSLERNLKDLSVEGLIAVADKVKAPNIIALRLFVAAEDSRDGSTKTLRLLSFANSGLGDTRFQILARSLRECVPLNTLNLSGCGLTDMNVPFIVNIVKGMPFSERIKPAEYTPGEMMFEQALECQTKVQKTSTRALKELVLQSTLRQSATRHSTCMPSKEIADAGPQGLRVLDLSYNQFTDDLANKLCPILYGEAPLSALNLQCNKLTREGASMFGAVMKEKKVLLLVDLRDNKLEVPTAALISDDTAVLRDVSVPIFPKEAFSTVKPAVVSEFRDFTVDKHKKNFLAKPKTHVIRKQISGSTIHKSMAAGDSSNQRPMCRSPGVHVAINKLPLRTKSIPERFHRRLVSTPMTNRQCLYSMNNLTMLSVNFESERSSQIVSDSRKYLSCKRTCEMGRPTTAPSTLRPETAPDQSRVLGANPTRRTSKGKAYFKGSGSAPVSARNKSYKSASEDIAPWEQLSSRDTYMSGSTTSQKPFPATLKKNIESRMSGLSVLRNETCFHSGKKLKMRKKGKQIPQNPSSRQITHHTVDPLVPLLGNKSLQTCPDKQKRRAKMKPNAVKRLELQFLNGKGCKAGDNQEMPPIITPLDLKRTLPSSTVTSKEDSQWNSFMSEMTMTLLNLKGRFDHLFGSSEPEIADGQELLTNRLHHSGRCCVTGTGLHKPSPLASPSTQCNCKIPNRMSHPYILGTSR
ncbi:uncharacterized protein [Physcomitrium patens]|uniref:uncharacterized protein isoform X4 n=1 Tax=Physcomitrium patens TaxID=3218 RepID=UPI000D172477|nr:uncharacterized protein LOC112277725 isoform X3 [Physcomitrium patens]|eukprot:XP_024366147.1 uncharacterized protein LOC112277725 isoform X3 [Physcomitrella patens]